MTLTRPQRIAVVEDDHHLRHDLIDFLLWKGFEAVGCESAEAFDALWQRKSVDLVLIDIGLPGRSGLAMAAELRALPHPPGIVMLTSFGTEEDRIGGLAVGADAYLTKGSSLELILATCMSVLRRIAVVDLAPTPARVAVSALDGEEDLPDPASQGVGRASDKPGRWSLHAARAELVAPDAQSIGLTHMEFVFLRNLMMSPGLPVARGLILDELGKPDTYNNLRNLDNCATRLRRKVLQGMGQELPVRSCYGLGYAFGGVARIIAAASR